MSERLYTTPNIFANKRYRMYQYWAFGLNIHSELEFPELLPHHSDKADLEITIGEVPEILTGPDVISRPKVSATPTEYLIEVPGVVRYYAVNGNRILIEPGLNSDPESIRLFMLSNAVAAILHQQNKIPFHASGIITEEGLVLFTGKSGAGKSTTVYGLLQKGYQLFTDDVCVLSQNSSTGNIEAVPSYPMIKLWENTIDEMEPVALKKEYQVRPNMPKYGFFQHDNFINRSFPVSRIYILNTDTRATGFTCNEIDKLTAFNELQLNTYRRAQVDMMNLRGEHFKMISRLTSQASVFKLSRPSESKMIYPFIQFVQDNLTGYGKK